MRKPRILLLRCRRYVMSGITRSMPSMPSSGNMRPASTTMMSSPTSTASMFFPISPTPPSGITRNGAFALAKERYLLHRFLLRLCRRRRRKEQRECRKVGVERLAQGWLMERRGRVVDGKDHQPVGGLARPAMDARDRFAWEEDPGVPGAIPGYRLARASMQRAGGTRADLIGDQPERRERGVLHRGDYAAAEGFRGAFRAR